MSKITLDNLHVGPRMSPDLLCVSWQDATHRYHFWDAGAGSTIETIYKNPLVQPERAVMARELDATSKTWAPIVAEAIRRVRDEGLEEAFEAEERAKREAQLEEIAEAARLYRVQQAGPALLEELRAITHLAETLNNRQHAGLQITPTMWGELHQITNRAKGVIELATKET